MQNLNQKKVIASWCLYEGAQSAFAPVILTLVFAPYFARYIAITPLDGAIQWSRGITIAGCILFFLAPFIGFISDITAKKKIWLILFTILCALSSALLWVAKPHTIHTYQILTFIVIGLVSVEMTHVMHNALLPSIASRERLSAVSGWSRGVGYVGTLLSLAIVFYFLEYCDLSWVPFANHSPERVRLCGPLVALWFSIFALPLFFNLSENKSTPVIARSAFRDEAIQSLTLPLNQNLDCFVAKNAPRNDGGVSRQLFQILKQKDIAYFLLASIMYIDALNTLTAMGGIYCSTLYHLSSGKMILFGIVMSVTAGTGAMSLGWLAKKTNEKSVLLLALVSLFALIVIMYIMQSLIMFVFCSFFAGFAIGIIYSASRSLLARIAPPDKITEIFSFYAIAGKATAFLGPAIAGLIMTFFHSQALGMLVVPLFIVLGFIILLKVTYEPETLYLSSNSPSIL